MLPKNKIIDKRGIVPIIAIILLLMMAIAAAAATFYWLTKIQGQMHGGTEQYEEKSFERMASNVNWIDAKYNNTESNLTAAIQNVGTTSIPLSTGKTDPTTSWILKDNDQNIICATKLNSSTSGSKGHAEPVCYSGCSGNLEPSEITTLIIGDLINTTECNITSDTTYANESIFYVDLYFSGKATAAGTFEK